MNPASDSTGYTTAPPSYAAPPSQGKYGYAATADSQPLLAQSSSAAAEASRSFGAIYDQPEEGDIPDDFKYGTSVADSSLEIRNAFVRKVYSILFVQILGTCIVGAFAQQPSVSAWIQEHIWAFYLPLFGALINLGFLYWKRHSFPANFILLGTFTLMESLAIGVVVGFYDQQIVLQALLITLGVFLGLTLFTMQSKYDFSGWGSYLYGGLLVLLMTGIVGIFFPFSKTIDLVYALGGTFLFSGYVIYDTFLITKKLSPDEFIVGAVSLYLDFINLFLNILRVLNNVQRD